MDVSVKIPEEDIVLLDDLKSHLRKRGVQTTKKQIIDESIKFALENEDIIIKRLKRKDNTKEMTERFLKHAGKFDFGKNWMEEIDTTL